MSLNKFKLTKEEIHTICENYNITNYTINDDLSITVDGDVDLSFRSLDKIPLNFREVTGIFNCSHNHLTSLKGSPKACLDFLCYANSLITLEGAPNEVSRFFYCDGNPLESIKGIPLDISEAFLDLPIGFSYSDYINFCNSVKRDNKFKKILK